MLNLISSNAASTTKGALVPIQTITLASSGGFTFSNIPQIYQDLFISVSARSEYSSSTLDVILLSWPYTQNHSYTTFRANGSTSMTIDHFRGSTSYGVYLNSIPTTTSAANSFGYLNIHIFDYTNTTRFKNIIATQAYDLNTGGGGISYTTGTKNTTTAITELTIGGGNAGISAGSRATLYGIRGA